MNFNVGLAVFTSARPHYYFIRRTSEHPTSLFSEAWAHYTVGRSQKTDFQLPCTDCKILYIMRYSTYNRTTHVKHYFRTFDY